MGDAGGEAASLREAPLPQTPSPEERLAFELVASAELVPPERRTLADKLAGVRGVWENWTQRKPMARGHRLSLCRRMGAMLV